MSILEMSERIAKRVELDRLRVEVRKLRADNEALIVRLAHEAHVREQRMWMNAMQDMTPVEQARYASQSFGQPTWRLFGNVTGARWP
jgi:hypothetical protein